MVNREDIEKLLTELPVSVQLVAAAKTRTADEILQAIDAGIKIVGENYLQDAEKVYPVVGKRVRWHFIGHLQRNKVKKVVQIFDMIETVDNADVAAEIDKRCEQLDMVMPVLIEINSGRERQKSGVFPEEAESLIVKLSSFKHIRIEGLMTMGPRFGEPESSRPYFIETRRIYEKLSKSQIPGVEMRYLSMGMSNSYKIALEEGANMVRLGTRIFGERSYEKG
jgi:pyridoxal phosphate enzyme (YggS family)